MSEVLFFIGDARRVRQFDKQHGDAIIVQSDHSEWGTLEVEMFLLVRMPDLTPQEKAALVSGDNKIKIADVERLKDSTPKVNGAGNWAKPERVRYRSQKFDFTQLSQEKQDIIEEERVKDPADRRLYTRGVSRANSTTALLVKAIIDKPDITVIGNVEADEQFISDVEVEVERKKE